MFTMSKRTIRCKMQPTPTMAEQLTATCEAFAAACNSCLTVAVRDDVSNNIKLHHACYASIRADFGLSANLAVRAVRRVSAAMTAAKKRGKQPREFRPTSIDYDARIFAFREQDETVSLTVLGGRLHVPLVLGDYQRDALKGKRPTAAVVVRRKTRWDIHIVVEDADAAPSGGPAMGVDLGIRYTAATSFGTLHSGAERQQFKADRARIRASLQSKNTRGARAVLRRLSGYERRRIKHENHVLAKRIVSEAQRHECGVVRMEQLSGIRERTKVRNKHLNRMVAGWSFGQLQGFVAYKAQRAGIAAELMDPAYSSKTCSQCGQRGVRRQDVFRCIACGESHADSNAALNLAAGGVAVTRPEFAHKASPCVVESRLL